MQAKQKMAFRLSKTDYLQFLRCPQEFWLEYHQPLMVDHQKTMQDEHLRQQGYDVEKYVRQLARFAAGDANAVDFQRTFQTADLIARSDIVVTDRATGEIDLYEIKSTNSIKDEHYHDVAFQKLVAQTAGERIRRVYLITMNGEYVRRGDIDVEQLFKITDVTAEAESRLAETEMNIRRAFEYLTTVPVPALAEYCIDNKLDCRFLQLHFTSLPDSTVFDLLYLKHDRRRELLLADVVDIRDVPDDFPLSEKQRQQIAVARSGEPFIDREQIATRMGEWEYPLHFLDYETFQYAIPQFDGVRPFQQMVFQYSLHTIDRPGAEVRHTGHLARSDADPSRAVAEHLREAMKDGIGTVFVWYEPFEKTRNEEMAQMFPDLADFFNELNARTCDLMKIFADNLYIDPRFKGRTSIKKVLPVVCPHLSYEELGIQGGMDASISWYRAVRWESLNETERLKIFNDLEEYCELDTFAMVEIYRFLRSL
jgi:CRISPR/Cas system-associated exonuclease Cas4 (RecB family)